MSSEQRARHLSRIQSKELRVVSDIADHEKNDAESRQVTELSVSVNEAGKGMNIPITCLEGIWRKAAELLRTDSAMVTAPGQCDEARMVLSYSGKPPHLVIPGKGGCFSCDSNCPNWKSMGICSHIIAVAEVNGKLNQLVSFLQRKKKPLNLTSLVTADMPRGRGRKGGAAPRSRKRANEPEQRSELSVRLPMATSSTHASPSLMSPSHSSAAFVPPSSPGHIPTPFVTSVFSPPNYYYYPPSGYFPQQGASAGFQPGNY